MAELGGGRQAKRPIRVVAVDDHPTYAHGLRTLLPAFGGDIEVVAVAVDVDEAIDAVENTLPDVVLMDVRIPGGGGVEALRRIRRASTNVYVIMLTVSSEPRDVHEAMKAGASGYLTKDVAADELTAAIRTVKTGEVVLSPSVVGQLMDDPSTHLGPLTEIEVELLRLLATGLEQAEIAKKLAVSPSTLKRQLHDIQAKLAVDNRMQAVVAAAKKGLV
jgi:DNA-binding NarL/FixJ family response regulator